jgi:hypothetical protein
MVACEASGAREHGHDSKQEHQVEGPIMQAKGGREHLGGATMEHAGTKVTKGR